MTKDYFLLICILPVAVLGADVDAVAIPDGKETVAIVPEPGIHVKVHFDTASWHNRCFFR